MAANTSRIVVDAGGRIFHTTRDTLLMSGAGYFTALFGPTGAALRSLGDDGDDADASELENADGPSTKRSRIDPTEVFIDRDPDLFRDILNFMRSGKLSAKVRQDPTRLEDLTTEAEFFIYDALKEACSEAKTELKKAVETMVGDKPKAECNSIILHAQDNFTSLRKPITVPRGKVLYLVSAVLAGALKVKRYAPPDTEEDESNTDIRGCYINSINTCSGDFKLSVSKDNKEVCIAHCGMNHIHGQGRTSLNVDFRQPLGLCLTGGENERVRLHAEGHADWHIVYWVGDAEAIPGLKSPDAEMSRRKVIHQHHQVSDDDEGNDKLTTLLAMQLLNRH